MRLSSGKRLLLMLFICVGLATAILLFAGNPPRGLGNSAAESAPTAPSIHQD